VTEPTVDLVDTLKRIEEEAARAKHKLETGHAKNGVYSLERIRLEAADALVRQGHRRRHPAELVAEVAR
jgi:hypothetical protein